MSAADEGASFSCRNLDITASNASSFKIDCVAGCRGTDFQLQNISDFWMQCAQSSCYGGTLNISDADSVNIGCSGTTCFDYSDFHFENAGNISMDASTIGHNQFRHNDIYLYGNTGHFSMWCTAQKSCYNNQVYATDYKSRYDVYCPFLSNAISHHSICHQ